MYWASPRISVCVQVVKIAVARPFSSSYSEGSIPLRAPLFLALSFIMNIGFVVRSRSPCCQLSTKLLPIPLWWDWVDCSGY